MLTYFDNGRNFIYVIIGNRTLKYFDTFCIIVNQFISLVKFYAWNKFYYQKSLIIGGFFIVLYFYFWYVFKANQELFNALLKLVKIGKHLFSLLWVRMTKSFWKIYRVTIQCAFYFFPFISNRISYFLKQQERMDMNVRVFSPSRLISNFARQIRNLKRKSSKRSYLKAELTSLKFWPIINSIFWRLFFYSFSAGFAQDFEVASKTRDCFDF